MAQAIKHMAVGIMDLRNYFPRKRSRNEESCDQEELAKVDSASKGQALDDAPERKLQCSPRPSKRKFTKPDLPRGRSGKRNILGCTAMIHKREFTTTFNDMIQLQIENWDEVLKQHVESGPLNAQYTSNYSVVTLLDARHLARQEACKQSCI